ncbi:MAG TPA: hypothetical protein DCF45_05300 [Gammaproteobacteria bacterium]|nr:hypothetical protein [Gammaproteobacteria bacterium]
MNDYTNDDEQLDALKRWWSDNGRTVLTGAGVGIALVIGVNFYQQSREQQFEEASSLYEQNYTRDLTIEERKQAATLLTEQFSNTPYSSLAGLADAKTLVNQGDLQAAEEKLAWVADHAEQPVLRDQARLNLARVLIALDRLEDASQVISEVSASSFGASVEELKGDIAVAQNDYQQALTRYQGALTLVDKALPGHAELIQLKLDAVSSRR